jgi:hypothetical protein
MSAQLNARSVLLHCLEEEKAELLRKLEQVQDETCLAELAACDRLLKRIRELPQLEAVR